MNSNTRSRITGLWSVFAMLFLVFIVPSHATEGAALHQRNCASCHNGMFPGGKGEMLYSADFRKIKQLTQLRQRVETCASRINAGWFDEEIDAVTQWLNQGFYRFQLSK